MDFALVIRKRLEELGLDQRDLANALEVTESYISQLLGRKKIPPLPNRTDLYDKMSKVLGLPREELGRLVALEHHQALDQKWQGLPAARFGPMRELVLRKCRPARQRQMRAIFEKQSFGELEQLITRTLIEVVRREARAHARDNTWVRSIASRGRNSYREMRVRMIDLLDSDPRASIGDFSAFLDPLIDSWDFDPDDFRLDVKLANGLLRRFGFREQQKEEPSAEEPGLRTFLRDSKLSSGATAEEIEILRGMRFPAGGRPTALFYYRTLQSLRDPLHFSPERRQSKRGG
ncbi:MAG: XRE family transcriptional regulator [Acidobacteria bacterium]|nr:MAG: XRE family transcriptional regulator [Acidobacteriota bacterium]